MSMETKNPPSAPGANNERYERRDADIGALLKFGLGLAVVLMVVFITMRWTFDYYARSQKLGPPVSPFESGNVRVLPPSPRLQVVPQTDLKSYCEAQQKELTTYGWVDPQNGFVRVPIDRAMKKLLARGLPVRAAADTPATAETKPPEPAPSATMDAGPCGYLLQATAAKEEHGKKAEGKE
jgi:hypothetical protein